MDKLQPRVPLGSLVRRLPWVGLMLAVVATTLLYLPTLTGPLVLDSTKLGAIERHLAQGNSCLDLPEFSGLSARRIPLLSFCLNLSMSPEEPVRALRLTNLSLHLLNGMLVFALVLELGILTQVGRPLAMAAAVSSLWLLAPIHTSTVPYVIQRMTLLSATFTLTGLLFFCRLLRERSYGRRCLLAVTCCASVFAAFLCKENGALAPLFMLLIWWTGRGQAPAARETVATRIAAGTLLLTALGSVWLVSDKVAVLLDYSGRDFDMSERLLTQARAMWFYVGEILFPHDSDVGLFQDDFPPSRSLLDPPSTGAAVVGLLLGTVALINASPLIRFGGLFFLAGHLIESTIFPLELVFLHRNYLPSFGIIIVAVVLLLERDRYVRYILGIALTLLFCVVTALRSSTWASAESMFASAHQYHPASRRAASEYAQVLVDSRRFNEALGILQAAALANPASALPLSLQQLFVHCLENDSAPETVFDSLADSPAFPEGQEVNQALENLLMLFRAGRCRSIDIDRFREVLSRIFDKQMASGTSTPWDMHYFVAQSYLSMGDLDAGIRYLFGVLDGGEPRAGYFLFDVWMGQNHRDDARKVMERLEKQFGATADPGIIAEMRRRISESSSTGGTDIDQ